MVIRMSASADAIHVMSGGAPKEVFALLTPKFEQQTGHRVKFTYAVITALQAKLAAGEKADVLVLPAPVLDGLARDGKVRADGRATFGTVGISVVVKDGARRPDISSPGKFRDAMLAARAVVHATPGQTPSGTHMGQGDGTTGHRRRHGEEGHPQAGARRRRATGGGGRGRHRHLSGERDLRRRRIDRRRVAAAGTGPRDRLRRGGECRQRGAGRGGGLRAIHGSRGEPLGLAERRVRAPCVTCNKHAACAPSPRTCGERGGGRGASTSI